MFSTRLEWMSLITSLKGQSINHYVSRKHLETSRVRTTKVINVDYLDFKKPNFPARAANGQLLSEGLFAETLQFKAETPPVYTLKEHEIVYKNKQLPSAYQVILWSNSEYDAAIRLLGSIRHWERLKKSKRIWENGVTSTAAIPLSIALEDMNQRIQALAKNVLIQEAQEGNVNAAKSILPPSTRQRKKKEEKPEPAPHLASVADFSKRLNRE